MSQQIAGISYDYVHNNGHFLVMGSDGRLLSSELANLQVQMLQSNTIPRLLPVSMEELDLSVSLRYDLSSKRTLFQVVQDSSLSLIEYYELLLMIATALDDSKSYMLLEDQYILQENYIFIGAKLQDIYLLYLPIKPLQQGKGVAEQFRELAMNLIGYVREVKGDGFQSLLNYCRNEAFSVSELKKLLKRNHQKAIEMPPIRPLSYPSVTPAPPAPSASMPIREQAVKASREVAATSIPDHQSSAVVQAPLQQREKMIMALVLILTNALVLKVYMDHPSEGMMLVCLGLTLLTLDGAYIFSKFRGSIFSKKAPSFMEIEPNNIQFNNPAKPVPVQASAPQPQIDPQYYNHLSMQTTLLGSAAADQTVLLTPQQAAIQAAPFLEIRKNGQVEKHPIHGQKLVIGRGGDVVHYVEDVIGVSRTHLEISQELDGWHAKDLGSKNGSRLNDEQMTGHKSYALQDGDVIRIVKTEFVFRAG
ncbi:DUF6382 domain-containing protein [Cohnella lupini]|uniref:FHA domain-containing protein n=1 Tax=Cohnella lupini TaxID=1294267 RepID=A0A3D9IMS1_9BACL|nr:DUF6382 domain-containing protein [Cohnella lupini]RED63015.1 FHA domain-containing protein [Cohnella lupini]